MSRSTTGFVAACLAFSFSGCTSAPPRASNAKSGAVIARLAVTPEVRRVWKGPAVDFEGSPSPDGRSMSTTDWSTGDLALHDFASDSTRRITAKGSWTQSSDFAESSAISPDGKTVVFGWFSSRDMRFDLRAMAISGPDSGKARTILTSTDIEFVSPQSFTPDGRAVATVIERHDRTHQIALVPLAGGSPTTIKSFDWRAPAHVSISPDGRWLAYDFAPEQKQSARDVFVLSLDGRGETTVLSDKGDDFVSGWSPDGTHLLVGSERGGTPAMWALTMAAGKPAGEPVLVRSEMWRMTPMGGSADGSIFYGVFAGQRDIYTAVLDAKSGKIISQPTSVSGGSIKTSPYAVAFSPDAQYVAYVESRGSGINPYSLSDVVIRSIDRDEVRRISPDLSRVSRVYWMPDGKSLLVRGSDQKGRPGLYKLALESGAVTALYRQQANFPQAVAIARDGSHAFFLTNDSTFTVASVHDIDLTSGAMRTVYQLARGAVFSGIALSPDGRQLALGMIDRSTGGSMIQVVPAEGGTPRELIRISRPDELSQYAGLAWSPDGDIYFGVGSVSPQLVANFEVRRMPAAGGEAQPIGVKSGAITAFKLSPDGRHIAFGLGDSAFEVWVMQPPQFSVAVKAADGTR